MAEQECDDACRWIREQAGTRGWDANRISVAGGGSLEYGASDFTLPDESRTSPRKVPVIGPWLLRMIRETYLLGADLADPSCHRPSTGNRATSRRC